MNSLSISEDRIRRWVVLDTIVGALLGEVPPNLRALRVNYGSDWINFTAYFDGPISEVNKESMSCVETELLAAFPQEHKISYMALQLDYPNPLPQDPFDLAVFRRREL